MFQDDLLAGSPGLTEARTANMRVAMVMREKRLRLNKDKSVCLVWGSSKQKKEIMKELEKNPSSVGR